MNEDALRSLRTTPDDVCYQNCKNCGAPFKSAKCEYCGTLVKAAAAVAQWAGWLPYTVVSGLPGTGLGRGYGRFTD